MSGECGEPRTCLSLDQLGVRHHPLKLRAMSGHVKRGALAEERWKVSKLKQLPAEGMGV